MTKFNATIEFLPGQGAAIVTLFDSAGEWSGSGRVECRSGTSEALYEVGYTVASRSALAKGGRLETYRTIRFSGFSELAAKFPTNQDCSPS